MSEGPNALYETLARYQWWRRGWGRARPGERLEIRKQLVPAEREPRDSGESLDRWLFELARPRAGGSVLDLGCGFGVSLLRWLEWSTCDGLGVTASRFQAARANEEATRRGLAGRCRFLVQDFEVPISRVCDGIFAIEALGHARDLAAVLANVRRALAVGGRFVWVEDLTRERLDDSRDAAELARRWVSPPLRDVASVRQELQRAGLSILSEADLTDRVAVSSTASLERRATRLSRWRALLPIPPLRRLADAFLGGCALERLYARGHACYLVFVCEPSTS